MASCIFCSPNRNGIFKEIILENDHAFAVLDNFPVSPGHTLIISKMHYDSWFTAPMTVQNSILALQQQAHTWLQTRYRPDGYNVGTNCGIASGQSVFHLHYHIIPRFIGDHPDPTGGIKRIFFQ